MGIDLALVSNKPAMEYMRESGMKELEAVRER
jgi:hypothetical protein